MVSFWLMLEAIFERSTALWQNISLSFFFCFFLQIAHKAGCLDSSPLTSTL